MGWYKYANRMSEEELNERLMQIIRTHPFFKRLMDAYQIPFEEVEKDLIFKIKDLGHRHAEADAHEIAFHENLFDDGDFVRDKSFFFIHEFFHWVKRKSENMFYFNDPEEVQSFVLSIAWEIAQGKPKETIVKNIFPIVSGHFEDESKAVEKFTEMYEEAVKMVDLVA